MERFEAPVDHEAWFDISFNDDTGLLVQGRFEDEELHIRHCQEIPDNFYDANRHLGQEQGSLIGNTQDHRRLVARIPTAVMNLWAEEDRHLDEDAKWLAFQRRLNDNEYQKLRVGSGVI